MQGGGNSAHGPGAGKRRSPGKEGPVIFTKAKLGQDGGGGDEGITGEEILPMNPPSAT